MAEIDAFKANSGARSSPPWSASARCRTRPPSSTRDAIPLRDLPRPESPDPGGHPALGRGVRRVLAGCHAGRDRARFGPAGRVFHGGFVTFSIPRGEHCPADIELRFGLEAGVAVDSLILFYDLEIVPVFIEFERHDQVALPLDPSSVEKAVEWFKRKALAFTGRYVSLFFDPEDQKGSEVPDVVLGRTFPATFAKDGTKYRGVTYHFLTEESRKAFEQDPTRYVGSPQEL